MALKWNTTKVWLSMLNSDGKSPPVSTFTQVQFRVNMHFTKSLHFMLQYTSATIIQLLN